MGADLRDRIGKRHRELVSRHELLGQGNGDEGRVFDATNELMVVLDEAASRAARFRRLAALILVLVALVVALLVVVRVLASPGLVAAAVILAAAVGLWLTAMPKRKRRGR
ncbi:hypothetical protein [Winogradskya humida]|uniref:DUF3040 domain-containing protein n=1 Tax=Winogradskya humida TaxID=113566 RepID=A0ABQ3ZQG9_9ACTN|nr:hypothetical protein [Actinoplanes humidus]GIE20738.1 hypothetical protein Ahu01nite_038400 [Actinoplanes humidus]